MRSIPPITANEIKSTIARHWRVGLAVVAGLLIVMIATVPWHGSTTLKPAADRATATAPPRKAPPPYQVKNNVVKINAPINVRAPGKTSLPWPSKGQAAMSVVGLGTVGRSGSARPVPMASVAKAMTAYLILKHHPIHPNGTNVHVRPSEAAMFPKQVRMGQSLVPVRSNEVLTERQALQALMLSSADNMAQILARWDAGSVPKFLHQMNAEAKRLGMTSTHYTDPSGYDKHTVSTVTDQMKLAKAALYVPGFRTIASGKSAVIPVAGHIKNFNKLLWEPGVVGIKTGSMSAAGGCLLFAAKTHVAGHEVAIVGTVLGQRSGRIGDLNQAFASSHNLLAATKGALKAVKIVHKGQLISRVPGSSSTLVATNDVTVPGWAGMSTPSKVTATFKKDAANGTKVGTLTVGSYGKTPLAVHNITS